MAASEYRLFFGTINAGGSPAFIRFEDATTHVAVTAPAITEIGSGLYGFSYDWALAPSGTTAIEYIVALNGVELWKVIASTESSVTPYVPPVSAPFAGQVTLAALRTRAKQRADMVNSTFVTDAEWTSYLNGSYAELYGLLIEKFGANYYAPESYQFQTAGTQEIYSLPDGSSSYLDPAGAIAKPFFKSIGVDVQALGTPSGWLPLKPFPMGERNSLGILSPLSRKPRYRFVKNSIWLRPTPQAGLRIQVLYAPRLIPLSAETDIVDGVSGWEELIVVDAARKALLKEESDTSGLEREKAALIARIEHEAENRDIGEPEIVADVQRGGYDLPDYGWPY